MRGARVEGVTGPRSTRLNAEAKMSNLRTDTQWNTGNPPCSPCKGIALFCPSAAKLL